MTGCENYPDPTISTLERYSFDSRGKDQKTFAGDYLRDSIQIQTTRWYNRPEAGLEVFFEVISGGGMVDQTHIRTDQNGDASTRWKLGTNSCEQHARATIFNSHGKYLTEIDFRGYGFRNDTWDTLQILPEIYISDMIVDTTDKMTFIAADGLYKQGEKYFDWIKTENIENVHSLEIDSKGTIYAGTWHGELYRSTDNAETWVACAKPIPDYSGYFELYTTPDNYIWVSRWEYGLRCSRDGGLTWTKNTAGLDMEEEMDEIFRLSNGSLLSLSRNKLVILRSDDDGFTWTQFNTPEYTLKIYVTRNDEIIACNQDDGFSIWKSTDLGEHYTKVFSIWPEWGISPMKHIFHKYGNIYYVLVPGAGILRTTDFNDFEIYWRNNNLVYLFVDHNGVLLARDWWNENIVYYRKNSD